MVVECISSFTGIKKKKHNLVQFNQPAGSPVLVKNRRVRLGRFGSVA